MTQLLVAIPTRNRADLAIMAVESVLRDGPDRGVDVLVSDNSTADYDRTPLEDFCRRHGVDYVRPPQPLGMADHWEWLWQHPVRGRAPTHVTYLTDRLVFPAGALAQVVEIIGREPEQVLSYQHDLVDDSGPRVGLVQSQWTGKLFELDSGRLIELASRGEPANHLPRMLNSVAPTAALTAIERRFGSVFLSVAPDYCFAFRCLATRERVLYLDRSCVIEHGTARSAGITYLKGRPNDHALRFQRELSVERFGATPEPAFETTANAIFQEYCTVREQLGGGAFPAPDRWSYLRANAVSVDRLENPEWRARMTDLLRRHGWTRVRRTQASARLLVSIGGYFLRHPSALARSVKRQLWDRPPGSALALLLERLGVQPRTRDELRFDSAAEAIAYASRNPRARTAATWQVYRLSRAGAVVEVRSAD